LRSVKYDILKINECGIGVRYIDSDGDPTPEELIEALEGAIFPKVCCRCFEHHALKHCFSPNFSPLFATLPA